MSDITVPGQPNFLNLVVSKLEEEVISKTKHLLEEKHLYQSVRLELSEVNKAIFQYNGEDLEEKTWRSHHRPTISREQRIDQVRNVLKQKIQEAIKRPWKFETENAVRRRMIFADGELQISVPLPTVRTRCNRCHTTSPHDTGCKYAIEDVRELTFDEGAGLYSFPYQCQSCKGEPLIFMVRREDLKLQLVGRSQFEEVDVPKSIPKEEQQFYSDAVIAFNTGRILAALFYLRTLIEQYMRRVLTVTGKLSGDELGNRYAELLDAEFPRSFSSLKRVYNELSERIHAVDENEDQFKKSKADIEKHCDLLQHFPLRNK